MQSFTIRKSPLNGKYQITIPCSITGIYNTETVGNCTMKHIEQVAKSILKKRTSSAQEVAIIAESRYNQSLTLRAKRYDKQIFKQEVWDSIDRGFIPSVRQLRKAGML